MTARSPYLMSGLGHAVVLGTFLTLATLTPAPRIVPGIKIVAVSGRSRASSGPASAPRPQVQPPPKAQQPEPPAPATKPAPKPVDKAPPEREPPKPTDPRGTQKPAKQEIVSKTPAKAKAEPQVPKSPATSAAQPGTGAAATAGTGGAKQGGIGLEAEGEAGLASAYLALLRDKVASNWQPPAAVGKTGEMRAVVYFTIERRGGDPLDVRVEQPSGDGSFDRAAMRAVMDARPLQPLPQQWPDDSIAIRFTFFQSY